MPDRPADDIEIRPATPETLEPIMRALGSAFGESFEDMHVEHERHVVEYDRAFGAWDGDQAVGSAGVYSLRMTVPGGETIPAAGITSVGVVPSHRRRGLLRRLMRVMFDQARERGEPVAILWASEAAIYQRFGFGMATMQTASDIPRERVRFARPVGPIGDVRFVDGDEAYARIPPIYDVHRGRTPGAIERSEARWRTQLLADAEWMQRGMGIKQMAVLAVDGADRAYTIYRIKHEWELSGPANVVTVLEVVALDGEAEQAMWEWITSIDLVQTISTWRGRVPHPLQLMLTEPRRFNSILNDGMYLRILDLRAALEARTFRGPTSLVLEVADDLEASNAGRWRLMVGEDGRAVVDRTDAPADLSLDIGDLATVYLGAIRFADLAAANRIRECREGALAAADAAFATDVVPHNSTMF